MSSEEELESINNSYFFKHDVVFKADIGIFVCLFLTFIWITFHSIILYLTKGSFSFFFEGFEQTFFKLEHTLPLFIAGIIIQELFKSLLLLIFAKVHFNQQIIGFSISSFLPYVHSKFPILLKHYRRIIFLSTISILSLIFLCYYNEYYRFLFLTSFWVFFSGYDLYTIYLLRKYNQNYLVADHQDLPGAVIYDNPF